MTNRNVIGLVNGHMRYTRAIDGRTQFLGIEGSAFEGDRIVSNVEFLFRVHLENSSVFPAQHGPLFSRFLPNGRRDALIVPLGHPRFQLSVWFERYGAIRHDLVEFDLAKREVPSDHVERQAVLEGGPLHAALLCREVDPAILASLRERRPASELVDFVKMVLKLTFPRLQSFLGILRDTYGQYWIPNIEPWDSRRASFTAYCSGHLSLRWTEPPGLEVHALELGEKRQSVEVHLDSFDHSPYISREDWSEISALLGRDYTPPFPATLISRAHGTLREGEARHAVVETATAIEATLSYILQEGHVGESSRAAFEQLPLPHQLGVAAGLRGRGADPKLQEAFQLIAARNRIVHEGAEPPSQTRILVTTTLELLAEILETPRTRFPTANHGNRIWPSASSSAARAMPN